MSHDENALLEKFTKIFKKEFDTQRTELNIQFTTINTQLATITKNNDTNTKEIKKSISGLKQDTIQNTNSIVEVNTRVDHLTNKLKEVQKKISDLEQAPSPSKDYMANITRVNTRIQTLVEKTDNTKLNVTKAARKIIGISPITQNDLERLTNTGTAQEDLYAEATREFLTKELKYKDEECSTLDLVKIT